MAEVGLIITAEDKAATVLKTIGATGAASLDKVRKGAAAAGKAFSVMGAAATALNQAMELGKKGIEIFRMAIGDTIATALEFRKENDPVIKQFETLANNASVLRARLGDVLIPIVQGLADAFNRTGNTVVDFINTNRKLIATNITVFLADTARILIEGIAVGVIAVSRAWTGWLEIINLVKFAVNSFFGFVIEKQAEMLGLMKKVAGFFNDDLAAAIGRAEDAARGLNAEFQNSADDNIKAVQDQVAAQDELEKKILKAGKVATEFVGEAQIAIEKRIQASIAGTTQRRTESTDSAISNIDRLLAKRAQDAEMQLQLDETVARQIDANLEANKQRTQALAQTISGELASSIEGVIQGTKTMGEAYKDFAAVALTELIKFAIASITTASATGGANAAASSASAGPAGVVAAPFVAATMVAFIKGFLTEFQFGGVVQGGTPNRDSVPALLTPGERVLTQRQNAAFEAGQGNGGGGVTINAQVTAPVGAPSGMSDADTKNWILGWSRPFEELVNDGLLQLGQGAAG
jgi:hypothetical protein